MEKLRLVQFFALVFILSGCSSSALKYDKPDQLLNNSEFEQQVQIQAEGTAPSQASPDRPVFYGPERQDEEIQSLIDSSKKSKPVVKSEKSNKKSKKPAPPAVTAPKVEGVPRREPSEVEDQVGFVGRRPIKDPFRVGEEVVHSVNYFKVRAGELSLRIDPFVQVNGRKSYSMVTAVATKGMFSNFYSADDKAVTFLDFDLLIPRVFSLHVKESTQLKEARSFFDFEKLKATYWEKKVTKKDGVEERKQEWEILSYSQNVFSAAFYMRVFQWEIGKEYAFRVANEGENVVFRGKALRKERISTDIGEFNTIVIQPQFEAKGVFKPVGDIYFWLSDDDRKFILKIESSIKIGTLVSEVIKINPGQ